jgi:hypothetical protein
MDKLDAREVGLNQNCIADVSGLLQVNAAEIGFAQVCPLQVSIAQLDFAQDMPR